MIIDCLCVYDGCLDIWTFLIATVKRDAFTLFVRVIALYKTSVLLLLLLFIRNSAVLPKLSINGTEVDRGEEYKYLGTVLDNKLNFTANTNFIYRKCVSRFYCLFKLKHLGVNTTILKTFLP